MSGAFRPGGYYVVINFEMEVKFPTIKFRMI